MRRPPATAVRAAAVTVAVAVALLLIAGVLGRTAEPKPAAAQGSDAVTTPVDRLEQSITRAQERLRRVPGDWLTWAGLGLSYLERARVTSDPTWYPKAEEAVRRSLAIKPSGNTDALVASGALANARHDFSVARRHALAAVAGNAYHAEAYAVLADAETQLGHTAAATAAIQRLLDLRPGLSAYARASYDLELRGRTYEARDLMGRALATAVDRYDIAFCRAQLGDLAFNAGDLATADMEYVAGLAADPTSSALRRGKARVAAARMRLDEAIGIYAVLTRSAPTPSYLIEYAELLRAAGRAGDADAQLRLAAAGHELFLANGGSDGLTGAALAEATGQPAKALAEARTEWSRRRHVDVADTLGWALHLSGKDREALKYARLAYGSGARSATYAYHLGMIEKALGDRAAARTHLERALDLNPHFSVSAADWARRALTELEPSS
jgi:tetratricopeptide (TPR) repeat protein